LLTLIKFHVLPISNVTGKLFSTNTLRELYPKLEKNINSLQHRRRLHTLEILSSFDIIPFEEKDPQQKSAPQNDILWQCLAIEAIEVTVENYREKTMQIRKLHTMVASGRVNEFYKTVAMRLCLGRSAFYLCLCVNVLCDFFSARY
jgi:hypothetical protein